MTEMLRQESVRSLIDKRAVQQASENLANAPWYILRPISRFMSLWDILTTLALLFTAAITPFEVAFLERAESPADGLFVANRLLDVIFVLDMVIQFFLMYRVGADEGSGTYWEYRLKFIALHYFRGWFLLDVCSIFPSGFDIMPFVSDGGASTSSNVTTSIGDDDAASNLRVLRVVRTTRLLKLVRLVRSSRLVTRWRTRISITFATLTVVMLALALVVATHWLACLLALQTIFAPSRTATWLGAFGWCIEDLEGDEECAPPGQLYVACLHWAFGIISGYFSDPHAGPYPPTGREPGEGGSTYTTGEMMVNLLLLVLGALGWAYVSGKIVDIIVNANPDATAFKNRMDDLNRYIGFYGLRPEVGQRLREYFYETKNVRAAEARREICSEMSSDLQELVCDLINRQWLETVPFFRGMNLPDGTCFVAPVEKGFLARVATELHSQVFAPTEQPPAGFLYVISKGSARYKGTVRSHGFSWGQLDVMLPNAPLVKRAIATTYLHVMHVDGKTLRSIAEDFPKSQRSMRVWTLYNGLKEYMLDTLRKASEEERRRARVWVAEQRERASAGKLFRRGASKLRLTTAPSRSQKRDASSIPELSQKLDALAEVVRSLERRLPPPAETAAAGPGRAVTAAQPANSAAAVDAAVSAATVGAADGGVADAVATADGTLSSGNGHGTLKRAHTKKNKLKPLDDLEA